MSEWIEWKGGECPVDGNIFVTIKYRDGEIEEDWPARFYRWDHRILDDDIIAYRIVKEKEE
ncbi:hypothetical protein FEE59_13525 [Herbaspirillum sp. RU 5E]|nr:hypothetical protein [Herbaspirillum sp. RU 5E]